MEWEIVSADSRQIYTGMDIGTGKDVLEEQRDIRFKIEEEFHGKTYELVPYVVRDTLIWLYDVVLPSDEFSVSHYAHGAKSVIQNIRSRGKLPIIVGGTGLYIKALVDDIETLDVPRSEELRNHLETKSVTELQDLLREQSLTTFEKLNNSDRHNPRRLMRKIEIAMAPPESRKKDSLASAKSSSADTLVIALTMPTECIEQQITERVKRRIEEGVIAEVIHLHESGFDWDLPAMNTFGYKEWKQYLEDPTEPMKQRAENEWIRDECSYVKKQLTWFKKQNNLFWFDTNDPSFPEAVKEKVRLWYTSHGG